MGDNITTEANEGGHIWLVENFSQLSQQKVFSDIFQVGGHFWRLVLCPKGLDCPGHISLYLEAVETAALLERLRPTTTFKIIVVNQVQPGGNDFVKETRHEYKLLEDEWGFAQFALAAELLDPEKGFYKNDSLEIKLELQVEAGHTQQLRQLHYLVLVATDAAIAEQIGSSKWFDLLDLKQLPATHRFRVHKLAAFSELQQQLEDKLGIPADQQRLWIWDSFSSLPCVSPTKRVSEQCKEGKMIELRHHVQWTPALEQGVFQLCLYLETPFPQALHPQPVQLSWFWTHVHLFFKYFDRKQQKLSYIGHRYFPKSTKVAETFPLLARMAGLHIETDFVVYVEVATPPKALDIRLLSNQEDLAAAKLEDGAVLCIQEQLMGSNMDTAAAAAQGEEELRDGQVPSQGGAQPQQQQQQQQEQQRRRQCMNIPGFYLHVSKLLKVKFTPLPGLSDLQLQQLWLLPDDDYSTVTAAVAAKVGVQPASRIKLTLQNVYSLQPLYYPVSAHAQSDMKLSRMLQYAGRTVDVIYYEVLPTAEARLQELQLQLLEQQAELSRARIQLSQKSDTDAQLQKVRIELDTAHADLDTAHAELVELHADLALAKLQLAARSDVEAELDTARAELATERAELARRSGVTAELACLSAAALAELADTVEAGLSKIRDAQREKSERERCCPICWESPKDVAFNCGHQACEECSQPLQQCPICRQRINIKIKLYDR